MCNYITAEEIEQGEAEPLSDKTKSGRERPWAYLKSYNVKLSDIYAILEDDVKAERLRSCGRILDFVKSDDGLKLRHGNLCHVRLCPLCQWRRSLKVQSQMTDIMSCLPSDTLCAFVTLTIRNVQGDKLSDTLDNMTEGVRRLMMYSQIESSTIGWYRALEITQRRGMYHPHYHMIWVLSPQYFSGKYISQRRLCELWQKALKLDYTPVCDIRMIKAKQDEDIPSALREVCKYTVKPADLISGYLDLDINTVAELDYSLDGRRFVGLGGTLKDIHKKLHLTKLDDDTDLELCDASSADATSEQHIYYCWCSGYSGYYTHPRYTIATES